MTKKLLLPLLVLGIVFFVICSEYLTNAEFDPISAPDEKERPVVESTNKITYPAIAVDHFLITPDSGQSFTVPYAGHLK